MVELAQPLEQVQHSDVDLGPIDPVVGLEVGGARPAPFSGAGGEQPVKCGLLGGGGAPAQVGHADNVFSSGQYRFQDGVPTVHCVGYRLGADRPEPRDLAHLAVERVAPEHDLVVHPEQDLGPGCLAPPAPAIATSPSKA